MDAPVNLYLYVSIPAQLSQKPTRRFKLPIRHALRLARDRGPCGGDVPGPGAAEDCEQVIEHSFSDIGELV